MALLGRMMSTGTAVAGVAEWSNAPGLRPGSFTGARVQISSPALVFIKLKNLFVGADKMVVLFYSY